LFHTRVKAVKAGAMRKNGHTTAIGAEFNVFLGRFSPMPAVCVSRDPIARVARGSRSRPATLDTPLTHA